MDLLNWLLVYLCHVSHFAFCLACAIQGNINTLRVIFLRIISAEQFRHFSKAKKGNKLRTTVLCLMHNVLHIVIIFISFIYIYFDIKLNRPICLYLFWK